VNFKTKEAYSIYFQFSLKDPWLLPKCDKHFGKGDYPLYGWLFFYFGRETEGIIYETSDVDTKIKDRSGKHYYLFRIKDRDMKDKVRLAVKNKADFEVKIKNNDDGTEDLTLVVSV
jgi:hypothetical protein